MSNFKLFFQCGNYGIGGHYGTHPDFYDYDEKAFYDPNSKINRISTVMAVLEAPEAGKLEDCQTFVKLFLNKSDVTQKDKFYWNTN